MMHRVKDLSPEQRVAVEALLGRTVSNEEAVSVRAITPAATIPSQLSAEQKAEALKNIDAYFAKIDTKRKPVSEGEEDALFVDAMRSVRPNFRATE